MRAALYLRTSSQESNLDNQRAQLTKAAAARGWQVIAEYVDEGVSGAKGREKRPGLDKCLKDATRNAYQVILVWSVDRLGRSLPDLINSMRSFKSANVQMYIHQQAIDTSTPAGMAMFGMLGVFAEFERAIIRERILAGMERARAQGKRVGAGKPPVALHKREFIVEAISQGKMTLREIATLAEVSVGTVHKMKKQALDSFE